MKFAHLFSSIALILFCNGCGSAKKIKYIFPADYKGYHVFIESSDAAELDANGRMTTIVVPEGRISFIPSFSVFREWHIVEAERRDGSRIVVEDGTLNQDIIRLYSCGEAGVLLNGEKREGSFVFLGDSNGYESFREFKARNNIDPNTYQKLPNK